MVTSVTAHARCIHFCFLLFLVMCLLLPEKVVRNDHTKIRRDLPIQTDKHLLHNRPDTVLINYKEQTGFIVDIAVPRDENIQDKELEKMDKYQSLKINLERLWKAKIMVIPVVVGAIADRLPGWLDKIPGTIERLNCKRAPSEEQRKSSGVFSDFKTLEELRV